MGTQVKIADTILKKSGDYLLAVKDNQPSLNTEVKEQFQAYWDKNETDVSGHGFTEQFDSEHGRKEHRRCWVLMVDESMPVCQQWKVKTIIPCRLSELKMAKAMIS
jgi:predicted transposase YbfD/YdcC